MLQLRSIDVTLPEYATEHAGKLPTTLEELSTFMGEEWGDRLVFFVDPVTNLKHRWLYFAGGEPLVGPKRLLVAMPFAVPTKPSGAGRAVLFSDHSISLIPEKRFMLLTGKDESDR